MKWWVLLLLPFQVFTQDTTYNNCKDLVKTYQVQYDSEKQYYWNVIGGNIILQDANIITVQWPSVTGQYKILASCTINGECFGEISEYVINITECPTVYLPSAFTPNGDGLNEIYEIKGALSEKIKYMAIYDRWGRQIVEANNNILWDGENYPSGIYSIIVLVENEKYIKNITLIR